MWCANSSQNWSLKTSKKRRRNGCNLSRFLLRNLKFTRRSSTINSRTTTTCRTRKLFFWTCEIIMKPSQWTPSLCYPWLSISRLDWTTLSSPNSLNTTSQTRTRPGSSNQVRIRTEATASRFRRTSTKSNHWSKSQPRARKRHASSRST